MLLVCRGVSTKQLLMDLLLAVKRKELMVEELLLIAVCGYFLVCAGSLLVLAAESWHGLQSESSDGWYDVLFHRASAH